MIIKNCPFCGSSPTVVHEPIHGYRGCFFIYIKCTNSKCQVTLPHGRFNTIYNSEKKALNLAIERWNDRKKRSNNNGDVL